MILKKYIKHISVAILAAAASGHLSAGAFYAGGGTVERILIDKENYDGCMAYVAFDNPQAQLTTSGCDQNFVAFGCNGSAVSKTIAQQNLANAQLALVTRARLEVFLDDSQTFNVTYCQVIRTDVAPPP